jgi:hypothetical protein
VANQAEALWDVTQFSTFNKGVFEGALERGHQASQGPQNRGFANPRCPDDPDDVTREDVQIDA